MNHQPLYRRFAVTAIAALELGLVQAVPALAASTLYVGPSAGTGGSCPQPDFSTIQAAVGASASGDTIHICAGTYNLGATISIAGKDLTFVGDVTSPTILDGGLSSGIFATDSDITVTELTLQNGSAPGGGAIAAYPSSSVSVSDSTFLNNRATGGRGGAIDAGALVVSNSTFSSNSASSAGGAIASTGVTAIVNSTFSGNSSATWNGDVISAAGAATISNSILAGSGTHNCDGTSVGSYVDGGGNLSTDATCGFVGDNTDIDDLVLQPLADNGGTTKTIALGLGSLAINAGVDGICAASPVSNLDQRGRPRPVGTHCDSGAFEAGLASITISPATASVTAGDSQGYTAEGFDSYGNGLGNVTADTTLSIAGGGSCNNTAHTCTSTVPGDHDVTGLDGSVTGPAATLTITAGAAAKLAFTTSPASSTAGIPFGAQPVVEVQDAFGNLVTSDGSSVTLSIKTGTGTSGAALTCTTNPLGASSGIATFAGCKIDKAGTAYQLHAVDGALAAADSTAFDITSGTAVKLVITGSGSQTAGASQNLTITAVDGSGNTATAYTGDKSLTFTGAGSIGAFNPTVRSSTGSAVAFGTATTITFTAGVATVSAGDNGVMTLYLAESALISVTDSTINSTGADRLTVIVGHAGASQLVFTASPASSTAAAPFGTQPVVTVEDAYGNVVTSDISSVTLSITAGTPTSGGPGTLSGTKTVDAVSGIATFTGLSIETVGTAYRLHAVDGALAAADSTAFDITSGTVSCTYNPLPPARLLDTRIGIGLKGASSSHVARTFQVTGRGGVPSNATAVTGNLTVTQQTSGGFLYIGPVAMNNPTSSTLNFPLNDDRANAVTVALGAGGTLSITYAAPTYGPTAQVIFDVTGYFTPDTSGATYFPLNPTRLLDSRYGTGLSGAFSSHVARTFQVTGGVVPTGATAVTGNLTVTGQTRNGFLYIGPVAQNNPTSSTLNFPLGDDRANSVTVALSGTGTLSVTYAAPVLGPTAHVIFDVTGYFVPGMGGATYVPLNPTRLLDSRDGTGLSGAFVSHVARTFGVTGGVVPADATAVTGNLTVTQQLTLGFLFIGPVPMNNPTSSTLNFPVGDDRANAVTVALGAGGTLSVTYAAPLLWPTTHVIFDVTGYFRP